VQTRLSLFCDKIIEAGWLTVAIVVPLFFNWYSNRVFEASKAALLSSITVVMLAAWLIKILEARSGKQKASTHYPTLRRGSGQVSNIQRLISQKPLLLPSFLVVATCTLTTITSIDPRVSFWGSYHRRQGLYIVLCYIAIFFLMLETLRTRQQLERLITVILLTSLPVSLYGIIQHYGVDPLVWIRVYDSGRVESTLGNPILIGAYLIMVAPLTVWQLFRSFSLICAQKRKLGPSLALFGCYLVLLILQLICLVFTQSRGPMMGLMVGAFFFVLLLAVLREQRGLALAAIGVSIVLLTILVIFNLPNSSLTLPKEIPYVERLTRISTDISWDRSLIWHGAAKMIATDGIRALIGYGPETMGLIFHPYIHPDWAAMKNYKEVADRCHNETLDAWVTTGLIGLSAYLVFFGSIFYYGLKQLGLIASSRQRTFFVVTCLSGGLSGVLISWLVEGTLRWAGVGIPAGILLALVIYLMTSLFRQRAEPNPSTTPFDKLRTLLRTGFQPPTLRLRPSTSSGHCSGQASNLQLLLIILLSALVAHFVEIQSGIAIIATYTYFWLYAALSAIIGYRLQPHPEDHRGAAEGTELMPEAPTETSPPNTSRQQRSRRWREQRRRAHRPFSVNLALPHALLVSLILATTSFDLITHQFELSAHGAVIFGLLFAIWLFGAMLAPTSKLQTLNSKLSTYVLGSVFCFLPFIVTHAAIVLPGAGVERATYVYYAYVFSVVFAIAVVLTISGDLSLPFGTPFVKLRRNRRTLPLYRFRYWWFYPLICIVALLVILDTNLKATQADVYYKFALASEEDGEFDKAISVYSQAIQLAPHWSQYYASLGWVYGLKTVASSDADQRRALFEESLKTLEHARQMSPFDPDIIAKLGHIYWNWSSLTPDLGQKAERLEAAVAYYEQAVTLSPLNHKHLLKNDMVQTYLRLGETYAAMDKPSEAEKAYQKAGELGDW